MQLSELIRLVAQRQQIPVHGAEDVISEFLECLMLCFEYGEDVGIRNFGKFEVKQRPETRRTNPRTGEPIIVPEKKTVKFSPAPKLKARANQERLPGAPEA